MTRNQPPSPAPGPTNVDPQPDTAQPRLPQPELRIAGGAIVGGAARWLIGTLAQPNTSFPIATLAINLLGCLLFGALYPLLDLRGARRELRLFVLVGLLGGFTTFSTFSVETVQLIQAGRLDLALIYQMLSLLGGLGALLLGRAIVSVVRGWLRRP